MRLQRWCFYIVVLGVVLFVRPEHERVVAQNGDVPLAITSSLTLSRAETLPNVGVSGRFAIQNVGTSPVTLAMVGIGGC